MLKTGKFLSYTLCAAIAAAAALTTMYRIILPTQISAAADFSGGGFAGTELQLCEDGARYSLCGIPIASAEVEAEPRRYLVAGGTPFGIMMRTEGVLVITVREGSPAAECGLKSGDIIISVNGQQVDSNSAVSDAVQLSADKCSVVYRRGDSEALAVCAPANDGGMLKLGVWVRDSAAGLGTLTFVEPTTGLFGGLGHPVSDVDTGDAMPFADGEITSAEITGVVPGKSGAAGELCGNMQQGNVIGRLSANTEVGIFGSTVVMESDEAIPAAFRQEVHVGEAEILTTIDGCTPQRYEIEIEHINLCDLGGSRSMVIRITDERLLQATGGIVRGMSGSPILQDGRLAGAVTHVLLNDPTRGYAVFAESMLEAADNACVQPQ